VSERRSHHSTEVEQQFLRVNSVSSRQNEHDRVDVCIQHMIPSDVPQSSTSRGAIGGAADELGGDLRASVAAWAVSFGLAGRPLPVGELPQDQSSVPIAVRLETDAPVDDVQIDLRGGGRVFIQVKATVSVTESDQVFTSVIGQFSSAVTQLRLDMRRDRIGVGTTHVASTMTG
jgi:hypothetical protein